MPQDFSFERVASFVKKTVLGNIALGLIILPGATSTNLIIPQEKLDSSFNIPSKETPDPDKIQVPIAFNYMSQKYQIFHPGIDLATEFGLPIKPIKAGIIEEAGYSPFGYGNEVLIDNGDGMESLYAHMSKIEVKKGDSVNTNTIIGLVGSSGHSTGPHLHLEVHVDGKPVNPLSILPPLQGDSSIKLITSAATPVAKVQETLTSIQQ